MKKVFILIAFFSIAFFMGECKTHVGAQTKVINEDYNFNTNDTDFSSYNLEKLSPDPCFFSKGRLIMDYGRVYNKTKFEFNKTYIVTLKKAMGTLIIFNGFNDVKHIMLDQETTISYAFRLERPSDEAKYGMIGIGSYKEASFSGYSIKQLPK